MKFKKVKTKLLSSFGMILLLSLIMAVYSLYFLNSVLGYKSVSGEFEKIDISVLELRKSEKDFLMREYKRQDFFTSGKSKYRDANNTIAKGLIHRIDSLSAVSTLEEIGLLEPLNKTKEYLQEYSDGFNKIVEKTRTRGFKDWGVEGELRASIHDVEVTNYRYDKALMLMLRRHEKDFFLRKDLKYLEKFNASIIEFKNSIQSLDSTAGSEEDKNKILNTVDIYKTKFEYIVAVEQEMGLSEKEGLLGDLREAIHKIDPIIDEMNHIAKVKVDELIARGTILLIIALSVQLAIGGVLTFIFSNNLTGNILKIKGAIVQLANGEYPDLSEATSEDEFGETQSSLGDLVDRMKSVAIFSEKMGNGELDTTYDEKYQNGVLSEALMTMHSKLVLSTEEAERRNWTTAGIAHFGSMVRENQYDVKKLGERVISELIKYMKANQGSLYMINEENEVHMELIATYAWDRGKFKKDKIVLGQGLVGQAWQERTNIYMTKVPEDYISIPSGLGEATPRCIIIQPLKVNDEVFGMLEIGSFREMEAFELSFIEKIGESIASAISSAKTTQKTQLLLEQSQQQTEEMREQEEEMRQNQEELTAIQEDMERQQTEMEDEILELKVKLGIEQLDELPTS